MEKTGSPCEHESSYGFSYVTKDPQREALYENEWRICEDTYEEQLTKGATTAAADALWDRNVNLPINPPVIEFGDCHRYDPWQHRIELGTRKGGVRSSALLHELAHAKIASLGIGPFVQSHGPIFCRTFGQFWSTYTTHSIRVWKDRIEESPLQISKRLPDLDGYAWAVVENPEGLYAVRPAQRAVEIGWNVKETFTLHVRENHPMA